MLMNTSHKVIRYTCVQCAISLTCKDIDIICMVSHYDAFPLLLDSRSRIRYGFTLNGLHRERDKFRGNDSRE